MTMRRLLLSALLSLWTTASALAGVTCVLPFNLQNNTTADATQVMANYNALVACLQSAAAAGANSDITSIIGLTTPLSIAQGGSSSYIGGTSTGSANAQVVATVTPNGFSLSAGKRVIFLAGFTNNAATQINIGGTGLTNVFKQSSGGPIAMTGGEIIAGQLYEIIYDGTQYEILPYVAVGWGLTGALGGPSIATTNPPYPADTAVNLQLNASVGSNLLTVAIKNNSGTDPSTTNPVLLPFRDSSATGSGAPVWVAITSALSINTNAVGASMGCISGKMCRLWAVAFNDGGTPVMAFFRAERVGIDSYDMSVQPCNNIEQHRGVSGREPGMHFLHTQRHHSDVQSVRGPGLCGYFGGHGRDLHNNSVGRAVIHPGHPASGGANFHGCLRVGELRDHADVGGKSGESVGEHYLEPSDDAQHELQSGTVRTHDNCHDQHRGAR